MSVTSANYATCQTALRRVLANGGTLDGDEKRLLLDVVQHGSANERDAAATTLEALLVTLSAAAIAAEAAEDALEALLVTHFGILVADGVAPTQGHVNAMVAACATPRGTVTTAGTALIAANTAAAAARAAAIAGAVITDLVADDILDGRDT